MASLAVDLPARVVAVDEPNRTIEIRAKHWPLVSELSCRVEALDDRSCRLIQTQSYPGMVGRIFTALFHRRESGETGEYLKVWANYAQDKFQADGDARD